MSELSPDLIFLLCLIIFFIGFCYSSVGHGGASGYLGAMSFFTGGSRDALSSFRIFAPAKISTTALLLNILVSGTSFLSFKKAGHFKSSLLYPFLISSIPMAFIGGLIHLHAKTYSLLLALTLIWAALRLTFNNRTEEQERKPLKVLVALGIGAIIGLVSGMIGIGGGIFLSPLLLLNRWSTVKEAAAVSAPFIFINSISALIGRALVGKLLIAPMLPFVIAAFLGGLLGSYLGANRFTGLILRRILGFVLFLAAFKLLIHG